VSSDLLIVFERAHLLRVGAWGVASMLAGTMLLALGAWRGRRSPLLFHFGLQTAAWGAIDLAIAVAGVRGLTLRDYAAATRLDRVLWLNVGLDVGYVAVGATLALAGWLLGRRLGPVGAGIGIVVQGAALLALDAVVLARLGSTL